MSSLKIPPSEGAKPALEKVAPNIPAFADNSEETEKRKAINKLEFLKNAILQTHKQTKNACKEFYDDMSKTELLAFDCLMAEYLLTDSMNDFRSYINSFTRPTINLLSGDRRDENSAEGRTISLIDSIQRSIASLNRIKDHRIEQPKRAIEILQNIRSIKTKLESELKQTQENSTQASGATSRPPSRMQPPSSPSQAHYPIEGNPMLSSYSQSGISQNEAKQTLKKPQISPEFTKWMNKNLALSSESSENATLRSLFCSVCSRYQSVSDLKASVDSLRAAKVAPKSIDYQMCGLENIKKSPFITSVQSNYKFLQKMLKTLREQRAVFIPQCEKAMHDCLDAISSVHERQDKAREEAAKSAQKYQNIVNKKKADIEQKKKELLPYILSMTDINNPIIIENYANIKDDIVDEIRAKLQSPEHEKQRQLLDEIVEVRHQNAKLCRDSVKALGSAAFTIKPIYKAASDNYKAEELVRQNQRKVEQLTRYEKYLNEMQDLLKVNEIKAWAAKIDEVADSLETLQHESERLDELMKPLIREDTEEENAEYEREIEALEQRTQELIQERIRIENEIADAQLEHDTASEELFTVVQDLAAMQQASPACRSEVEEKQMLKLQKYILCPCCKANRRNCLISTCMHPICKDCMKRANGVCPVCKTSFTKNDVKPFYFQN